MSTFGHQQHARIGDHCEEASYNTETEKKPIDFYQNRKKA
jgi:hypothetical protein